jgi:aminoglycoside phosphotransferase
MKMTFKTISLKQAEAQRDEWKARAEAAEAEVERLLEFQRGCLLPHEANDLGNDLDEAKVEIERLRAALAEALRDLEELYKNSAAIEWDQVSSISTIRAALGQEQHNDTLG